METTSSLQSTRTSLPQNLKAFVLGYQPEARPSEAGHLQVLSFSFGSVCPRLLLKALGPPSHTSSLFLLPFFFNTDNLSSHNTGIELHPLFLTRLFLNLAKYSYKSHLSYSFVEQVQLSRLSTFHNSVPGILFPLHLKISLYISGCCCKVPSEVTALSAPAPLPSSPLLLLSPQAFTWTLTTSCFQITIKTPDSASSL